jgi:hypothetical protein
MESINEKKLLQAEAAKFFTRPFDLEHAKAGAPIALREGSTTAAILKWDARGAFPLVGLINQETACQWSLSGVHPTTKDFDLVMTPLGYIDGKPVFTGDKYVFAKGMGHGIVHPEQRDFDGCTWPAPEKQYPVTGMHPVELVAIAEKVLNQQDGGRHQAAVAVANVALRHAIDTQKVFIKEDVDKAVDAVMVLWRAAEQRSAARDMAIAKAAIEYLNEWMDRDPRLAGMPTFTFNTDGMHLAAIIAKVQP